MDRIWYAHHFYQLLIIHCVQAGSKSKILSFMLANF